MKKTNNNLNDYLEVRFTEEIDVDKMVETTISLGKKTIFIIGEEPLLYPRKVYEYCLKIRGFAKKIYLETSLPDSAIKNDEFIFIQIIHLIDELNVVLEYRDLDKNNAKINILKNLCKRENLTTTCNVLIELIKGEMDNKKEISNFLQNMKSIKIKKITFKEIDKSNTSYISFKKAYGKNTKKYLFNCHDAELSLKEWQDMNIYLKRPSRLNNYLKSNHVTTMNGNGALV